LREHSLWELHESTNRLVRGAHDVFYSHGLHLPRLRERGGRVERGVGSGSEHSAGRPRQRQKEQRQKKAGRPSREEGGRLGREVKALRALRGFEVTPAQLAEIVRVARHTAAKSGKREPAKASGAYIDALAELREALIANDEAKIEALKERVDDLQAKESPDLDDDIELSDSAEIEAGRLLNLLTPQQIVAYADSLADDLPEPVQSIVDGLEDGRGLKAEEWQAARDELAERVSWLVCGISGEKTAKLEQDVSAFLDRKHGEQGNSGDREGEIRKLVGSPGPVILLSNVLEHDLAELLSNPHLGAVTKACLRGRGAQLASTDEPVRPPVVRREKKEKKGPEAPPPAGKPAGAKDAAVADLGDVLKSPEKYDDQDVKFENVTITGTAQGTRENFLWLEVKTPSGVVAPAAMRGQKVTIIATKGQLPESVTQLKPGAAVTATLVCHVKAVPSGKHWNARVRRIHVHEAKE
jgi:hypothetical protein